MTADGTHEPLPSLKLWFARVCAITNAGRPEAKPAWATCHSNCSAYMNRATCTTRPEQNAADWAAGNGLAIAS